MRVLALDLASKTGWALGEPGQVPVSGVFRVKEPNEDTWMAGLNLWDTLDIKTMGREPTHIAFEAPIDIGAKLQDRRPRSPASIELPIILAFVTRVWAFERGIPAKKIYPATVRIATIGTRNAGDRHSTKRAVYNWAKGSGLIPDLREPTSKEDVVFDRCDAVALWYTYCRQLTYGTNQKLGTKPAFVG